MAGLMLVLEHVGVQALEGAVVVVTPTVAIQTFCCFDANSVYSNPLQSFL